MPFIPWSKLTGSMQKREEHREWRRQSHATPRQLWIATSDGSKLLCIFEEWTKDVMCK